MQGGSVFMLVAVNAAAWADIGPRGTNWERLMTGEAQAAAFAMINCLGNTGGFLARGQRLSAAADHTCHWPAAASQPHSWCHCA